MTISPLDSAPTSADLPDVLQFMQLLWAVVHGVDKTSKRMIGTMGVTALQRLVLRVAGLFPGLSAGDLATILHVHPSTLTGVLQRLVTQRLLLRVADPRDRRRAILRLTARGALVNAARDGTVESAVAEALEGLSDRDRAAARRVLEALARHLGSSTANTKSSLRTTRGGAARPERRRPPLGTRP
jgi:MarR family transcriptional regulator, organic hydroperoxide resistance regulator